MGYIYMIIKNLYFKQLNHQHRHPQLPLHLDVEEIPYDINADMSKMQSLFGSISADMSK